ncbi:hydrophobin, partial [Cyathus striatus]
CTTVDFLCCNSLSTATDPQVSELLGLLGIAASDVSGLVGVTCSPISAVGVGGNPCAAQLVCCANNSFNGLVALGCTPV